MVKKTVCLNMIVKNERQVIQRCLASVKRRIDFWVIVDTGSTDGTQELIREFLRDIPGELYERPWVDFAHNRNEALRLAKSKADYLLFIDADDELVFSESLPELERDYYFAEQRHANASSSSYIILLAASRCDWRWRGVLHENLVSSQARAYGVLHQVYNLYHEQGVRSKDPDKYLKDAVVLAHALEKEPGNSRYRFFLAESLRWGGDLLHALAAYQELVASGGSPEEIYWSLYCIAKIQESLSEPKSTLIGSLCKAHQFRPERVEPLYELANIFSVKGFWLLTWLLSKHALPSPLSTDLLHVEKWIYDWGMLLHYAVSSAQLGQASHDAFQKLLKNEKLPDEQRLQISKYLNAF